MPNSKPITLQLISVSTLHAWCRVTRQQDRAAAWDASARAQVARRFRDRVEELAIDSAQAARRANSSQVSCYD